MKNKLIFTLSLTVSIVLLITTFYSVNKPITNFEECIAAGNPAMESYPRQCRDSISDKTFTEDLGLTEVIGEVSLKGELFCPCFEVNGQMVWYDLMEGFDKIDVSEITNGDVVRVKGKIQPNGEVYAFSITKEKAIGGERDSNGCLGPAGYSWNETLQICLREWELKGEDRQMIEKFMPNEQTEYGKTLVKIVPDEGSGWITVWFDTLGRKRSVDLKINVDYICTEESRNADACIEIYEPVCGYFDGEKIQCIKAPCANTYSNSCFACLDENVLYYKKGECQ